MFCEGGKRSGPFCERRVGCMKGVRDAMAGAHTAQRPGVRAPRYGGGPARAETATVTPRMLRLTVTNAVASSIWHDVRLAPA